MARSSGGGDQISTRITIDGGAEAKQQLNDIGNTGKQAFQQLKASTSDVLPAFNNLSATTSQLLTDTNAVFTAFKAAKASTAPAVEATKDLKAGFNSVAGEITAITSVVLPGLVKGVPLGVAAATAAVVGLAKKAAGDLNELGKLARGTGFSTDAVSTIRALLGNDADRANNLLQKFSDEVGKAREAARKLAEDGGGAVAVIRGVGGAASGAAGDVTTLRGNVKGVGEQFGTTVEVFRGGQRNIRDTSDAFKSLGIDVRKFKDDVDGNQALLEQTFQRLANIKDPTERARIGTQLLGRQYRELAADIQKIADLQNNINQRNDQGLNPTNGEVDRAKSYGKALKDVNQQLDRMVQEGGAIILPPLTSFLSGEADGLRNIRISLEGLKGLIDTLRQVPGPTMFEQGLRDLGFDVDNAKRFLMGFKDQWNDTWGSGGDQPTMFSQGLKDLGIDLEAVKTKIVSVATELRSAFQAGITANARMEIDLLSSAIDGLASRIQSIISALQTATARAGAAQNAEADAVPRFASGGLLRGPGGPTGDRIALWGSDGEFMVQARAVRAVGVDFMRALNSLGGAGSSLRSQIRGVRGYAAGGLVSEAPSLAGLFTLPSSFRQSIAVMPFAGAASGGGGRLGGVPVHIHIGRQEFKLNGPEWVVENFSRAAARAGLLSGGRKPDYIGSR